MRPSPEDEGWKDPDRLPNIYKVKRTYPKSSDENSLLGQPEIEIFRPNDEPVWYNPSSEPDQNGSHVIDIYKNCEICHGKLYTHDLVLYPCRRHAIHYDCWKDWYTS